MESSRVYFITAFMRVDYTENPETIDALERCGNCFTSEAKAIACLQGIKLKLKEYE